MTKSKSELRWWCPRTVPISSAATCLWPSRHRRCQGIAAEARRPLSATGQLRVVPLRNQSKPFCDARTKVGFDGTETAGRESYRAQAQVVEGPVLALMDAESLCAFARFCDRTGSLEPVDTDDAKVRSNFVRQVNDCPSDGWSRGTGRGKPLEHPLRFRSASSRIGGGGERPLAARWNSTRLCRRPPMSAQPRGRCVVAAPRTSRSATARTRVKFRDSL
jgi:hypothetical protein